MCVYVCVCVCVLDMVVVVVVVVVVMEMVCVCACLCAFGVCMYGCGLVCMCGGWGSSYYHRIVRRRNRTIIEVSLALALLRPEGPFCSQLLYGFLCSLLYRVHHSMY
jgi:hypothetical protein